MNDHVLAVALVVGAFLLGSVPSGYLFARARGIDIRAVGSGNIGATNVARNLGKRLGAVVLVLDVLKGAVPVVVLARSGLAGRVDPMLLPAVGMAAIAGHCFSPWLRLRGGKGVATAFGVFLAVSPALAGVALGVFVAVYAAFRVASLGSLVGSVTLAALLWITGGSPAEVILGVASAALIVVKHRANIARLVRRKEHRV